MQNSQMASAKGPLLVGPKQARWLLNCGQTHLYELLNSGEIASFRDGKSRKIPVKSIESYIERKLMEAGNACA
jgi:excisionase family DNA binding protein